MTYLETYFVILVAIQLLHSIEEIYTRFDKRWPLWKMSRRFFVIFEILFSALLIAVLFVKTIPNREVLMLLFNVSMFANGVWHLMWAGIEKRYVPGSITAPFFIIVFLLFYFQAFL